MSWHKIECVATATYSNDQFYIQKYYQKCSHENVCDSSDTYMPYIHGYSDTYYDK